MNEFIAQFLVEARELTEAASTDLLAMEQDPGQAAHLDGAFRAFHTLKGAAGIMEYAPMERMLHGAENLLQEIRSGTRIVTPGLIDACLASVGQVVRWLDVVERTGEMPADADADASRVVQMLAGASGEVKQPASSQWVDALIAWSKAAGFDTGKAAAAIRYEPDADAMLRGEDPVAEISVLPGLVAMRVQERSPWPQLEEMQPFVSNVAIEALSSVSVTEIESLIGRRKGVVQVATIVTAPQPDPGADGSIARAIILAQQEFVGVARPDEASAGALGSAARTVVNVLTSAGRAGEAPAVEIAAAAALRDGNTAALVDALEALLNDPGVDLPATRPEPAYARRESGATSIRVDVQRIDAIVDLTGELLIVKNALAHWAQRAAEGVDPAALVAGLRTQHARLDRHVSELQRAVLDLRVLPLVRVFGRFPVLVRETAARLGKQVTFRTEGDDTEADKAVVEALFEPLLHVVRNAIDHGVELPESREALGKPRAALITMRGWREGEHVIVEVADDGRGIDPATVRRLAAQRGVASPEALAALGDDEVADLIFAPGFSTASSVSDLSGRGVGMNVVRSAVERMGGEVVLDNNPGRGLVVRFRLPFTVMMTRVMTVEAGGQTFGIPFDAVQETVRAPRSQIRPLGGGMAYVLRDLTIPVLDLAAGLGLGGERSKTGESACLVVVTAAGQRMGIEVDRPGERLDLMLKPVEGVLAGMPAISGTSLLGDGRVLIVLDLGALFG